MWSDPVADLILDLMTTAFRWEVPTVLPLLLRLTECSANPVRTPEKSYGAALLGDEWGCACRSSDGGVRTLLGRLTGSGDISKRWVIG